MTPKFLHRRLAYCRRLVALRVVPHDAYLILDSLAYGQDRPAFSDSVICSYEELVNALHMARKTIAACLRRLIGVGLIARRHRWELVEWSRGKRYVQRENEYRFVPDDHCEFPILPAQEAKKKSKRQSVEKVYGSDAVDAALARQTLADVAAKREKLLFSGRLS